MARYAMVIDVRKCIGCHSCSVSCKMENSIAFGAFRSWVNIDERGDYPRVKRHFLPRLCNHCQNPPCTPGCSVKATFYNEADGRVVINRDRCIGCGYCIEACPYAARFASPTVHTADKCDFCEHLLAIGEKPACVKNCLGQCRIFGDLDDPNSEVVKLLAENPVQVLRPELGTSPKVYYIGADISTQGQGRKA